MCVEYSISIQKTLMLLNFGAAPAAVASRAPVVATDAHDAAALDPC
jgi:hypothetical protein